VKHLIEKRKQMNERNAHFMKSKNILNLKTMEKTSLYDVYLENNKNKEANFFNRTATLNEISTELDFEVYFITITFSRSEHNFFKKLNDSQKLLKIKEHKEYFQDFFNSLLKYRLFRKKLNKDNRFYIKSLELHKSNMLHIHLGFFLKKEYSVDFINLFYEVIQKYEKFGRIEIVCNDSFKKQISQDIKLFKRKDIYIPSDFLKSYKTGAYIYFKFIKDLKNDKSNVNRYITKYISKNFKNNLNENDIQRIIFLELKIRNIVISNFLFPNYLIKKMYKRDDDRLPLYKYHSLKELTYLKHSKKNVIITEKLFKVNDFEYFDINDIHDKYDKNFLLYISQKEFHDDIRDLLINKIEVDASDPIVIDFKNRFCENYYNTYLKYLDDTRQYSIIKHIIIDNNIFITNNRKKYLII
jgi:hypothetical protein